MIVSTELPKGHAKMSYLMRTRCYLVPTRSGALYVSDKQTDKHDRHNTSFPYRGEVTKMAVMEFEPELHCELIVVRIDVGRKTTPNA